MPSVNEAQDCDRGASSSRSGAFSVYMCNRCNRNRFKDTGKQHPAMDARKFYYFGIENVLKQLIEDMLGPLSAGQQRQHSYFQSNEDRHICGEIIEELRHNGRTVEEA